MNKITIFDFDNTLYKTPDSDDGKEIYFEKTGNIWPYRGWWGRKESLDTDIFDITLNKHVFNQYRKAKNDSYVVLATGRLTKLRPEIDKILAEDDLTFDEIHLNPGMDTYVFKTNLFEKLISKHRPSFFVIYDDRQTHLIKFREWSKLQPCKVEIIDVTK